MEPLKLQGRNIEVDHEGYLLQLADWDKSVAELIANKHQITLETQHWEIITLIKTFYQQYDVNPNMRILIKLWKQENASASSLLLMQLFGESPLKLACKIAGLPKPSNCL